MKAREIPRQKRKKPLKLIYLKIKAKMKEIRTEIRARL
jgi:hypothetical protein